MATKKLTEKKKKFADYYIKTGNATESAKYAGYSEKTAYSSGQRLLKDVEVAKYVEETMEQLKKETIADADEVLQLLTSIARGETTEENAFVDKNGNPVIVKTQVKEKERIKALELLGKRYKLYVDKVEANVDGEVKVVFEGEDDIED